MRDVRLGPYRIESELGSGGMGTVYAAVVEGRARGLATGTRVALKVLHAHLLETPGFFKRFLREAEMGRAVEHPNVVRTFEADALRQDGEQVHFLVMEYVEGRTLRQLLGELERVPEELCRHIGVEVAKGLAAIHSTGVIHRDLKPENVLITPDHTVKLMDLGVARLADEVVRLSQTGAFVGSLHYAAPESFRGGEARLDGRVDLHGLGVVLYELASGVNPYAARDVATTVKRVLHEKPRRLGDVNPQLSPFLEEVVHTLIAKDRDERFADARELLHVLSAGEQSTWWHRRAEEIHAATRRPLRRIRIPRETAVFGRENELSRLRKLFDEASGGDGRVVLIEGEAGIGKSRLVDELVGRLVAAGTEVNFLFGSCPPGGAATAEGGFSTAYREQFGAAGSAGYLTPTPMLVPAFDALLRGEPTPRGAEPLTRDSLQTVFVHATRALASERPTVVLIDDLHFAPEEGLALFAALARAIPTHRVLLVGTTRPGLRDEWVANVSRLEHVAQLTLSRLGPKDLVRLLQDSFKSEQLAEELGVRIALKSDGNPFFVFEILRGLRDAEYITQGDDGTWVSRQAIDDIEIPASVLDLVNARVADLADEDRNLLEVAACCGFEFDPVLAGAVLGSAPIPTLQRFGRIEKRHRLVRSAGRRLVFDHHQVHEALYLGTLEQLREQYHAAIADALESRAAAAGAELTGAAAVEICEHLLRSDMKTGAKRYVEAAMDHLEEGYLSAAAVDLAKRALAVPGILAGRERMHVLLRLSGRLDLLARRVEERAALDEALALAESDGDGERRARVHARLGRHLSQVGALGESERVLREGLELATASGREAAEAQVRRALGGTLHALGRWDEADEQFRHTARLSRAIGDSAAAAHATGAMGSIHFQRGRFDESRAAIEEHLALAKESGDRRGEAAATGNLGVVYSALGRYADTREHYARHLEVSRKIGYRVGETLAHFNIGMVETEMGALESARSSLEKARALGEQIGAPILVGGASCALGMVADYSQNADEAERLYRAGLTQLRAVPSPPRVAEMLLPLARLLVRRKRLDEARAVLGEIASLATRLGAAGKAAIARLYLAHLSQADIAEAAAAFTECEGRLAYRERLEARYLLWRATDAAEHLTAAHGLLAHMRDHAPPECRDSIVEDVPLHREIWSGAETHGLV